MASTEKRLSKEEIRRLHQEACKEVACSSAAQKQQICPFCPWAGKENK